MMPISVPRSACYAKGDQNMVISSWRLIPNMGRKAHGIGTGENWRERVDRVKKDVTT